MKSSFNSDLVHQVIRTKLLNKRRPIASTKDRAQVAGGGKKPWPQKGTGRARAGSNRSPLWKGGGITFGPQAQRSYKGKITQSMSNLALGMVLERKKDDKEVIVCKVIEVSEPKTKQFQTWLRTLVSQGTCLVVGDNTMDVIKRAGRNMAGVKVVDARNVDILDVVGYTHMVITEQALATLEKRISGKK